jgi:hypothetical protein
MVTGAHLGHLRTDPFDDARALMSEHDRLWHRIDLISDNHVRLAHAGLNNAHQHLIVARLIEA